MHGPTTTRPLSPCGPTSRVSSSSWIPVSLLLCLLTTGCYGTQVSDAPQTIQLEADPVEEDASSWSISSENGDAIVTKDAWEPQEDGAGPGANDGGWQGEPGPLTCDNSDETTRREAALDVMEDFCSSCHSPQGTASQTGFKNAVDMDAILEAALILPGDPDASPILKRMRSETKPMPPAHVEKQPTEEDIAAVSLWAECLTIDAPVDGEYVSTTQAIQWMRDDLLTFQNNERRFIRYVTLHHLYNAGDDEETLASHRWGVSKLVNSLSWNAQPSPLVPIDARELVLRLDTRLYDWDEAPLPEGEAQDVWERIETVYPYAVLNDSTYNDDAEFLFDATEVKRTPYVFGDWLAARASTPPLYHEILGLPDNQRELENILGIDVAETVASGNAKRAGFTFSDVSVNNRVIERHALGTSIGPNNGPVGAYKGAFWLSYDFAGNRGLQNIFQHPVDFLHDGGEIIFNLPNGLQAYLISDKDGVRLDTAPISIVADPWAGTYLPPEVTNGLSCMSCHVEGMNVAEDDVRDIVWNQGEQYPDEDQGKALNLYAKPDALEALFAEDRETFQQALDDLGIPAIKDRAKEPISRLAYGHFAPLDLAEVANAVGLSEAEFLAKDGLERLKSSRAELATVVEKGGLLKREVFDESFRDIACFMEQGKPVTNGLDETGLPLAGCAITKLCNINTGFPGTATVTIGGVELQAREGRCSPCRAMPVGSDLQAQIDVVEVVQVFDENGQTKTEIQVLLEKQVSVSLTDEVEYVLSLTPNVSGGVAVDLELVSNSLPPDLFCEEVSPPANP